MPPAILEAHLTRNLTYMAGGFKPPIDPQTKEEIIERVRQGNESIAAISREFNVAKSTIHGWLEKKVTHTPNALAVENARLRREIQEIKDLFLTVSLELERSKKRSVVSESGLSKTRKAQLLGMSRQSQYYAHILPTKDEALKVEILTVLVAHPQYGYRRVALALHVNKKRIQRVMKKFL